MPHPTPFLAPISEEIWDLKYRLKSLDGAPLDAGIDDTFRRVASAAAAPEKGGKRVRDKWARRFHDAISDFGFLPAGRILAGAGTGRAVTLFNCFVLGTIEDDLGAIFDGVKEAALTMQQGGGIGHDFSTLRPRGARVASIGADASGPVSFMDVWDAMCRTIMSAGSRRGAMMATLRCDHPDIETFIDAKSDPARLRNFNLSVLVTDAFLAAVREDRAWDLKFGGKVYRTLPARALWERIMRATYDFAEPGVVFIDRVNAQNNLPIARRSSATNPCGEQPLPPYGACLLGSINLAQAIEQPFTDAATLDVGRLRGARQNRRALPRQRHRRLELSAAGPAPGGARQAPHRPRRHRACRRLDLLRREVRHRGGAQSSPATWMAAIQNAAYLASAELAAEKGAFPLYDAEQFLASPNVARLEAHVQDAIRRHGIRNGCLTSIAPTGTISLLAGNVSSGIEPVFDFTYRRRVLGAQGATREELVEDYAHALFRRRFGADAAAAARVRQGRRPVAAASISCMQAALQPHVDSSISKTINCPEDISFEAFKNIYLEAHALGLKGCTTFRPNPVTGRRAAAGRAEPRRRQAASRATGRPPRRGVTDDRRRAGERQRRRRLHGAAARARARALRLHLQAQVARAATTPSTSPSTTSSTRCAPAA